MRPIVSYTGTPLYKVSKHIADILKQYLDKEGRHSENSKVFSQYVRTLMVEEDEVLVSFDVTSLYTNVPITATLEIIKDSLLNDHNLKAKTDIPIDDFSDIVNFLLTKTWFQYNGKFYKQTDGVAMGGPASSVVAEIFMQSHDKRALSTFLNPPKAYERFVDDTFCIIKRDRIEAFHKHINSLEDKIKFTIEEEQDGKLPFLDTLLKRNEDGSISVLVYRKPTHTDQYLNYNSNHPSQTKDAVISALFRRAKDIISEKKDLEQENDRIVNVLMENDYDKRTILRVKRKVERGKVNRQNDAEKEEPQKFTLPYVPGTSEIIRRSLAPHNIKCAFYSSETLRRHLSKPKDTVPMDKRNNVVYKIPCKDCNATYIGESKRSFGVRYKEHDRAVRKGDTDKNEIADHCWSKDHEMNWDERKVIDTEAYIKGRKIKETIHSLKDKNHINSISYTLPNIWIPNIKTVSQDENQNTE